MNLYQTELRKPVHVAFCLDYSGSMAGEGFEELTKAMQYILSDEASNDNIQFSYKDKIDVVPFASKVGDVWSINDGTKTDSLLEKIKSRPPTGTTAIYPASIKALELLKSENQDTYNTSIILMTDGQGNVGSFNELKNYYSNIEKQIPIYSITFGDALESQLNEIAKLTNAKVFNGKENLVEAFKEVRGYN